MLKSSLNLTTYSNSTNLYKYSAFLAQIGDDFLIVFKDTDPTTLHPKETVYIAKNEIEYYKKEGYLDDSLYSDLSIAEIKNMGEGYRSFGKYLKKNKHDAVMLKDGGKLINLIINNLTKKRQIICIILSFYLVVIIFIPIFVENLKQRNYENNY